MTPTTWIGIDIAKADFVAAQRTQKGFETQTFPMSLEGFEALRNWLPKAPELAIVFEATGPYWLRLAYWLDELEGSLPYACINPRQLRDFAKASPERSKTDPIDAALLVHFAETFPPNLERPKSLSSQRLRALWRHHLELQNLFDRTRDRQEKASADPRLPAEVAEGLETLLTCLRSELDNVLRQASALVREDSTRPHPVNSPVMPDWNPSSLNRAPRCASDLTSVSRGTGDCDALSTWQRLSGCASILSSKLSINESSNTDSPKRVPSSPP